MQCVLMVALAVLAVAAQHDIALPQRLETIERPNCELLSARLDWFGHQLKEKSNGQIVLLGGTDPVKNLAYERYPGTKAYVVIRGRRSSALQLRSFLAKEMRDEGIPSPKVVFLFARKNINSNNRLNEVEVFISSKPLRYPAALRSRAFSPTE
jgi:hypothetical protein